MFWSEFLIPLISSGAADVMEKDIGMRPAEGKRATGVKVQESCRDKSSINCSSQVSQSTCLSLELPANAIILTMIA